MQCHLLHANLHSRCKITALTITAAKDYLYLSGTRTERKTFWSQVRHSIHSTTWPKLIRREAVRLFDEWQMSLTVATNLTCYFLLIMIHCMVCKLDVYEDLVIHFLYCNNNLYQSFDFYLSESCASFRIPGCICTLLYVLSLLMLDDFDLTVNIPLS